MYNFTMKMGVEKMLKKYWYYIILVIGIIILFLISSYDTSNTNLYFKGEKITLQDGLFRQDDRYFISYEDIKLNFEENVFYDKISKKLIITTWDNVIKIKSEDTIKHENKKWYDISYIASKLDLDFIPSKRNIYILDHELIDATLLYNRVELYDITENKVKSILDKNSTVNVIVDEARDSKWVNVIVTSENYKMVGRILNKKLSFKDVNYKEEVDKLEKQVVVYVQDTLSKNTDITKVTGISQNLIRLSGKDKITTNNIYRPSGYNKEIYAVFTNGYKFSNFDTDILTHMLNSDENKEKTIKSILEFLDKNSLNGVVLDFKKFKTSDKTLLTEYIKELGASLHKENKKLYINVENTTSIDIKACENFVDYIIVEAYGERTVHSKTFGAYSSVSFVNSVVEDIKKLDIDVKKIILGISPNSLLFTIRAGTIIDTEMYNMNMASKYIKANNLEIITDNINKMHYIDFKKGITSYKMWLEDEYSIKEKMNILTKNNLSGVSIYKSGDENINIYDIIYKSLEVEK